MMGPIQSSAPKLFHYGVSLEKRVRANNPLRAVRDVVDFRAVRERVKPLYGRDGHESEDPIVIMKLMLLLFLDDVSSERELMRIVPERNDYLWFLGMDLEEEIPDHSVLSKARKRWGGEVFEELFVKIIGQCMEAGLVNGKKIHMDGSYIQANASGESIRSGPPELIEALRRTYRREEAKLEDVGDVEPDGGAVASRTVSRTDPDAALARKGGADVSRLRYTTHRAIDDQCGVITATETTPASIKENEKLLDLVEQHQAHTGQTVRIVVADAQYGTNENFAACQQRGIRSHMADLKATYTNHASTRDIFKDDQFHYDDAIDAYVCPAGELLKRTKSVDRGLHIYRGSASKCRNCELRVQCTRSKYARSIKRHPHQEAIQDGRSQSRSIQARRDRRRRKHLMEGSFADAANNHGFKRARWRRLRNQQIQDLLIASCQNIRILMRHQPRRQAAAMQMAPPLALSPFVYKNRLSGQS